MGVDPVPTVKICHPTGDQASVLAKTISDIGTGTINTATVTGPRRLQRLRAEGRNRCPRHAADARRSSCGPSPSGSAPSSRATTSTSSVTRGEIHGVLGQNGAGKTTLMNVLLGLDRSPTRARSSSTADRSRSTIRSTPRASGIAMVHQHFSLVGPLTVWENVTLGERGRVDRGRTIRTCARDGGAVRARRSTRAARVDDLTPGSGNGSRSSSASCAIPSIFILDEPTSVLTVAESLELFACPAPGRATTRTAP